MTVFFFYSVKRCINISNRNAIEILAQISLPANIRRFVSAFFRNTLIDFITRNGIKQIVAEDVSVNNHFTDTRKLSEFRGILFEVCDTLDLPEPAFINPMTVKKFATGDGHAKKDKMMEFCRKRWQIEPGDDNEADAIHIFFCYIKRFKL